MTGNLRIAFFSALLVIAVAVPVFGLKLTTVGIRVEVHGAEAGTFWIIAACAVKATGGMIQGRLAPTDDEERQRAIDAGHDLDRVLTTDDLVTTDNCFFAATGITDGDLLRGVRYRELEDSPHAELAVAWRREDRSVLLSNFIQLVTELADEPESEDQPGRDPVERPMP